VYRRVIVPEIGGGATVPGDVFNDGEDGSEGNEKGQVQSGAVSSVSVALRPVAALQGRSDVRGRLARSGEI
jgi:hypothetical protein